MVEDPQETPVGWLPKLLTGIIVVLLSAMLVAAGLIGWAIWSLRAHQKEAEEHDLAGMHRQSMEIAARLREAATDGSLPDTEINEAVYRYSWYADRADGRVRVVVLIKASTQVPSRCYAYELTRSEVTRSEIPACPEATQHRELRTS